MRPGIKTATLAFAALIVTLSSLAAHATEPCPGPACTDITGAVADRHGNPIPGYVVVARHNSSNYTEQATTDAAGRYELHMPLGTPTDCYTVFGQANEYYSGTTYPKRVCGDATANFSPFYRLYLDQWSGEEQATFLADGSAAVEIPVRVVVNSKTFPAPFRNDPLAWDLGFQGPQQKDEESLGGTFDAPEVREAAPGIWQYRWRGSITAARAGHYDMDWGVKTGESSVFEPGMECKMVWFGFGITSVSPARILQGSTATVSGIRLGDAPGRLELIGKGKKWQISGSSILSWTDTEVRFVVPLDATSGRLTAWTASGTPTNRRYLEVSL